MDQLHELHVEPDPKIKAEMENMSRIYGLLMHATGAVSELVQMEAVTHMCDQVCAVY